MVYKLLRIIVKLFLHVFFRFRYVGVENIPVSGSVVIASNHLSFWDPLVIGCAVTRHIHFMAKEELFRIPVFNWIITQLKAFPVRRGTADRSAIRMSISLLEQGEMVGLFPEGTRSKNGQLGKAEPGLALIAAKAGTVIIPAAVSGTNQLFASRYSLNKFEVVFGKPIHVEKGCTQKEYLEEITKQVMSEIASLQEGVHRNG